MLAKEPPGESSATEVPTVTEDDERQRHIRKHLLVGWGALLLFVTLGVVLESLHGFKVAWYHNVGMETRRLTWRLAHAHGTFLAVVNLCFPNSFGKFFSLFQVPASVGINAESSRCAEVAPQSMDSFYIFFYRLFPSFYFDRLKASFTNPLNDAAHICFIPGDEGIDWKRTYRIQITGIISLPI